MGQAPRTLTPYASLRHYFGSELRWWRERTGLSQYALGRQVSFSGDLIGKVEKAVRLPTLELARACDAALGTGGALARLLPLLDRFDDRSSSRSPEPGSAAVPGGRVPDMPELQHLDGQLLTMLDELHQLAGRTLFNVRDHEGARPSSPQARHAVQEPNLLLDPLPGQPSLRRFVDRAAALWRGDQQGRVPRTPIRGPAAVAPVWEWENPPEDVDASNAGDRRVDPVDVRRLRQARARYQEMYRRVGGVPARPRIVATLNDQAAPLLRAAYDNILGRQLLRAVGALAALAGVCAYDADQQPLAQRYLFTALRMAKASGDREFGGYVVALLANQALYLDEYRLVVQYAETAVRAADGYLSPALVADLHALCGKAYARMGDTGSCRTHLRISEATAARIDHLGEPAEVSYVQPGLVETQVAEALRRLGDLGAAQTYAEESVRTAHATHLRGQAHRHAGLALILATRGEVDQGVHVAGEMLDCADGMESGRIRDRITSVVNAFRAHATVPAVADFLDRAHGHTTTMGA